MKWSLSLVCLTIGIFSFASSSVEVARKNYPFAREDKKLCQQMIIALKAAPSESLILGYLGAYQAVWAVHTYNPISKLNSFNEGKRNIEAAIQKAPTNIELRYIRLSIQKNCPSFLGYSDRIASDEKFIQSNLKQIESSELKTQIQSILNQ